LKSKGFFLLLLLFLGTQLFSQASGNPIELGKSYFQVAAYREALSLFRDSLSDPRYVAQRNEAYFWTGKTLFALERYDESLRNFDLFLSEYPSDRNSAEAHYLRARVYFLQGDMESAALLFARFIQENPRSPFVPNGYYWAGESYLSMGNLAEAESLFQVVIRNYPTSARIEAARYRLDVIQLKKREQELVQLLQWSQEESLRTSEQNRRQIESLNQAILGLQNQRADLGQTIGLQELQNEVVSLRNQINQLETTNDQIVAQNRELSRLAQTYRTRIDELERSLDSTSSGSSVGSNQGNQMQELSRLSELLKIQAKALSLKEDILRAMIEEGR